MRPHAITLALSLFLFGGIVLAPLSTVPSADAVIRSFPGDPWGPIGPFAERIQFQVFSDERAEFLSLKAGEIDFTDWPLTAEFESPPPPSPSICEDVNIICTDLVSEAGMFQIDFNFLPITRTAVGWWGVPFLEPEADPSTHSTMRLTTAGADLRAAVAHLVDKDAFINDVLAGKGVKIDYPVSAGQERTIDGTLISRTGIPLRQHSPVCQFDSIVSHRSCISAYNLAVDTDQTPLPGSPDWNAALEHFARLGWVDSNNDGIIDAATGAFPLPSPATQILFVVRSDHSPRTSLGTTLANAINSIFGKTVVEVDFRTISQAGSVVFDTNDNEWHLYTGGYRLGVFWDHIHDIWSSRFASDWCGGARSNVGSNYNIYCSPAYDQLAEQFKFSTSIGDAAVKTPPVFDEFGKTLPSIPVYSAAARQAYRNGWAGGIQFVGFNVGNDANVYTQLNARRTDGNWPLCNGFGGNKACIRQGLRQGTSTLNVFFYQTVWESWIINRVYDYLLLSDPFNPTNFYGGMAKGYDDTIRTPSLVLYEFCKTGQDPWTTPCRPAGTRMTARFDLHNYLRFHDGTRVTANDVAFSILAHRDLATFLLPSVANVIAVSKVTPTTIDIHFNQESVFFPISVGSAIPIMPQKHWDGDGNFDTFDVASDKSGHGFDPVASGIMIGSGPFICRNTATGAIGGGCTNTGTQVVPFGGSITLDRYDLGTDRSSKYMRAGPTFIEYDWADSDNTLTSEQRVTIFDIRRLSVCYSVTPGTTTPACNQLAGPRSAAYADFDGNGQVDAFDAVRWSRWFDESWTGFSPGGQPVTWSQYVNVLSFPPGPTGRISTSFTDSNGDGKVNPGEIVRFDASGSSDNLASVSSYSWSFGDGSTGVGVTATHTYNALRTYSIRLTITDALGLRTFANAAITVG